MVWQEKQNISVLVDTDLSFQDYRYLYISMHMYMFVVCTQNGLKRTNSFLGSQYICNVGFRFPTLGGSSLTTQPYLSNICFVSLSLWWLCYPQLSTFIRAHFSQTPFLSSASHIYSPKLVEGLWLPSRLVQ